MEFSKKLLIFSWIITIILTTAMIFASFKLVSLDGLIVVTPLSWAETTTATGFYYWKAKTENRAKYAQKFIREFAEENDINIAVQMAEIVLRD